MVCQLMGREREPPRARQIALDIKQAIKDDVGETLRCSIGMAPNRYLAKIASDMQKPDGLIGLLPSQLPRAIAHLELRDLPGVGARTEARLNAKGITHDAGAAGARPQRHAQAVGLRVGRPPVPLAARRTTPATTARRSPSEVQKSLGHSHVLAPEHRSPEGAWAVAHKLLHKAAMRLRMEKFYAGSLAVTIKYALTREQAAQRLHEGEEALPAASQQTRLGHGGALSGRARTRCRCWRRCRACWKQRPHGAGASAAVLRRRDAAQPDSGERDAGDAVRRARQPAASFRATMDKLNLKYGHTTLHFAGMLPARDSAPTRIAFTQIPVQYGTDWM